MGSPFGLAYGLGAGLAAGPGQAYYRGQDDAMARGLKELELAKARREAADTAAENAALSQPVAGPAATSVMSPGVTQEELDSHKVGPDEYGPNMPDDLQQISKPVQVTPFQSDSGLEAARLKQAAETLRSQGRGLSAMVYDKQAKELGKEHQKASVLALIQASKYGDNERMLGALQQDALSREMPAQFLPTYIRACVHSLTLSLRLLLRLSFHYSRKLSWPFPSIHLQGLFRQTKIVGRAGQAQVVLRQEH